METIRKLIQTLAALLTNGYWLFPATRNIYQGPMKIICSPGLNCYSCPASTTYCPIGAIQQLLLGVRFTLESGAFYVGSYVFGSIGLIGALTGRLTCGWLCPFGLIQELLHKIPSVKFPTIPGWLRYPKYGMLLFFVILFPLFLTNEWDMGDPWFCKYVCPAGTLEAGIPMLLLQPDLRATLGLIFYNKLFWMFVFLGWSVTTSRPFCRTTCPLGAFYGLFNRISLIQLRLDEEKCTDCGICAQVCPMGIQFNKSVGSPECIGCLRCLNEACTFGAISVKCGGLDLQALNRAGLRKAQQIQAASQIDQQGGN
ncbi:MAG: 4Fe-4S binding protein [Desulfobulbaceae bacterium]|uniref:4Fe-4S binding protein n=1 Tax=Candidatus Desulfatifera sulfidica TaxID=2841691 RepID=A0A8J6NBQ2_9BACT|nr:4Fe-4S binding protein [Candidatus Desulfatifera sulfidica]